VLPAAGRITSLAAQRFLLVRGTAPPLPGPSASSSGRSRSPVPQSPFPPGCGRRPPASARRSGSGSTLLRIAEARASTTFRVFGFVVPHARAPWPPPPAAPRRTSAAGRRSSGMTCCESSQATECRHLGDDDILGQLRLALPLLEVSSRSRVQVVDVVDVDVVDLVGVRVAVARHRHVDEDITAGSCGSGCRFHVFLFRMKCGAPVEERMMSARLRWVASSSNRTACRRTPRRGERRARRSGS